MVWSLSRAEAGAAVEKETVVSIEEVKIVDFSLPWAEAGNGVEKKTYENGAISFIHLEDCAI